MAQKYEAIFDVELDDQVVLPDTDTPESRLEFQNFVLESAEQNLATGSINPNKNSKATTAQNVKFDFSPVNQPKLPTSPSGQPGVKPAFWTIDYYAQFFDVDSDDVFKRLLCVINPYSPASFLDLITGNPDLYGPFWIPTTVIFALFASSSIAQSISDYINKKPFVYDVTLLSFALGTVYTFVAGVPGVLWIIGRYWGVKVGILEVLCVVGYGFAVWIPVSVLCILPSEIVRWIIVIAAFALSVQFTIRNLYPLTAQSEMSTNSANAQSSAKMMTVIVFVSYAVLALVFKFVFFGYVVRVDDGTPTPTPTPSPTQSLIPSPTN
ncbi:hypothetical protein HK098_000701 [Nowakowskiella sp. JEL0407]|nr:hypothetical protein HK098_000701 [Nowakowskiella sp. JEL0407]